MFLLLGAGFLAGAAALFSECIGGCFKCCKSKNVKRRDSIISNPRWHDQPTPREKLNSIQDNNHIIHNHLMNLRSENNDGSVKCEVHENKVVKETGEEQQDKSVDYDQEIDKIFNFDNLFGKVNDEEIIQEEIIECAQKPLEQTKQ